MIELGYAIQHRRDLGKALQISVRVAADLELEEGVAIGRNDLLQRFRQSVMDVIRVAGDGVNQPDGVASGDALRGRQIARGTVACRSGPTPVTRAGNRAGIDAGQIGSHRVDRTNSSRSGIGRRGPRDRSGPDRSSRPVG